MTAGAPKSTLVQRVRIFDGAKVHPAGSVLFSDQGILAVGDDVLVPPGCLVVDGQGRTLLPGLIDAHTHVPSNLLFAVLMQRHALAFGVTTTLDMGTDPETAAKIKTRAAREGGIADLRSAGNLATCPGGHPTEFEGGERLPTLSAPEQAERFVAERRAEGSDYLKVILEDGSAYSTLTFPSLTTPTVAALVDAAHGHEMLVIAHVSTQILAREAVTAGVDALAHTWVDAPPSPDVVAAVAEARMFVVPTLTVFELAEAHRLYDDPRVIADLAPDLRAWFGQPLPPYVRPSHHVENGVQVVRALHEAGVQILAGTDAPNPGIAPGVSLHRELQLLVASGLSPVEALAAATVLPAQCFGLNDRGRIAPEMRADLLLVEGDPTTNIEATLDIADVWMQGARFDRAAHRDANNA